MMSRWAERAGNEVDTSFVVARDTSRPFSSLDGMLPSRPTRVTFDGRFDNRRLVYERSAAPIGSAAEYLVANDVLELGMIAALRLPNPVAFALHGDYDYYYELAIRHAAQIGSFLCVSTLVQQRLKDRLPQRSPDIHLTYPVVPEPQRTRATMPAGAPLRLLFVGRLTEEKGFFDLPRIDSALGSAGVNVTWTVVAPMSDQLSDSDNAWLEAANVTHVPMIAPPEMETVYAAHDILVFPSRYEGFGMSVIEAMKCGVVPIASRLEAGIPEMIEDGRTGFTTNVGDYQSMASTISMLARQPEQLESMSKSARQSALERFDSRRAVASLTAAILAAKPRPDPDEVPPAYLSRLDRSWLPNPVVRVTRKVLRTRAVTQLTPS